MSFRWGHININVADLDASRAFYGELGFEVMIPGIPYLGLNMNEPAAVAADARSILGLPEGTTGRACIMQLGDSFPKIDLTELQVPDARSPLTNQDIGIVRMCLGSSDLAADCARLASAGIAILSGPGTAGDGLADVAIVRDPDGTLIELIQPHLEKWATLRR